MPAEQRAKISATLRGNANGAVKPAGGGSGNRADGRTGKRTGQALENVRAGQQRRRERERAERDARETGEA